MHGPLALLGGVILAVVFIAWVVRRVLWWFDRVRQPFRPQAVLTARTPWQILTSSCLTFIVGVLVILIVVLIAGALIFRHPEDSRKVVVTLLKWVIKVLQEIVRGLE